MSSEDFEEEERHFAVHAAAEVGDVETVRALLAEAAAEDQEFLAGDGLFRGGGLHMKDGVLNERSNRGWTPLHVALAHRHLSVVQLLLAEGAEPRKLDGSPCLHFVLCLAASSVPGTDEFVEKAVAVLLPRVDWSAKDDRKQTALHVAATFGLRGPVEALAALGGAELLELKDRTGNRALHYAAMNINGKANGVDAVRALLVAGANANSVQVLGKTPLHLAAEAGFWEGFRALTAAGADATKVDKRGRTPVQLALQNGQAVPADLSPGPATDGMPVNGAYGELITQGRTAVLSHPLCREHFTCPPLHHGSPDPPPENVNRLKVLLDMPHGVLRAREFREVDYCDDAQRAALADVLRVHDWAYVRRLEVRCKALSDFLLDAGDASQVSEVAMPGPHFAHLDGDTVMSARTFEAALRAAGSVIEGVDRVMDGRNRNVFCAVRPPGHHAGMRGVVTNDNDENGSHGFCFLNNVGIAAAYARHVYRGRVDKVAIVDFDVHHGNGTEEVVRNLVPATEESVVQTPVCSLTTRAERWKPWLNEEDHEKVLFVSSHGYGKKSADLEHVPGGWFYPGSGPTCVPPDPQPLDDDEVRAAESDYLSGYESETRMDRHRILDLGLGLATREVSGTARNRFRDGYRKVILPRLMAFNPDLILISAGFDGHKKDDINFGYLSLVEEDFEWVTDELIKVANSCCGGRVVSVLEGGYAIKGSHVSAFARSTMSHVRALLRGSRFARPWDAAYSAWESRVEHEMLEKAKERQERKNRDGLAQFYGGKDMAVLARLGQVEEAAPADPAPPEVTVEGLVALDADAATGDVVLTVEETATTTVAESPGGDAGALQTHQGGNGPADLLADGADLGAPAAEEELSIDQPRKRRRGNVDYVALAQQLADADKA